MGGLTSSSSNSTQNTNSTTTTAPLPEQSPYISQGWGVASNLLNQNLANPYTGNFVAAPNQNQYDAANNQLSWATSSAPTTANQMGSAGRGQLNNGVAAQTSAVNGLNSFANSDPTANNIAVANQYASQQNIGDQTRAAMYDATQNAAENTLPTLYRNAAGSGNLNSDRTALAQGVVQRGLNEQASNISANLRANAFNQGLQMAQNQNNNKLSALNSAGQLGSTQAGQGYTGMQAGYDNYGKSLAAQQAAGDYQNSLSQAVINNGLQQYYASTQLPWQNLNNYWNIVGQLKGGTSNTQGTTQTQTTQTPSLLSSIGSIGGLFGSLFG